MLRPVGHPTGAPVPDRPPVRPRVRHRNGDQNAGARRRRRYRSLPWYAILTLPILFAAGMCLLDTADGVLMLARTAGPAPSGAQGVLQPHRHLLSVAVALLIGGIELVGALVNRAGITSGPLAAIAAIDLNDLGYLVVGLFLIAWLLAVAVWKFGRIEQRWS